MAKAAKGTKAAKAVEVELTPEQKAANARRAALRKLLGTHSLQSAAWTVQSATENLQRAAKTAQDDAAYFARSVATGYVNGSIYANVDRLAAAQAEVRENAKALLVLARNSVHAYESALALGATIEQGEVIRLVVDSDNGTQVTVAVLAGDLHPEFEMFQIAVALGFSGGQAVYVAEAQ